MELWNRFRFNIDLSEGIGRFQMVDLLIADSVVSDILDDHREAFKYWRFHRRWASDGHHFDFEFYGDRTIAESVHQDINANGCVRLLQSPIRAGSSPILLGQANWLEEDDSSPEYASYVDNVTRLTQKEWQPCTKKAWLHFVRGSSESLLAMIDCVRQNVCSKSRQDVQNLVNGGDHVSLLNLYSDVNDAIYKTWLVDGSWAFFHHVHVLFGMGPTYSNLDAEMVSGHVVVNRIS